EIVAGLIEPNESAEETIRREAQEEARCQVSHLVKIGEFYNTPGGFAEKTVLFCAQVRQPVFEEGGVHTEHEDIRIHVLPIQDVLVAWEQGTFASSASTVIALQWLKEKMSNRQLASILKP
ncbi:MAG TPA: NUDIX hydrolase, partial [Candidatus Berkiella sp.]|nr:NUDIX hydrolase [Candidatus Berkiella sp.]